MSDYISRQAAIEAVDECTKLKITDDFYTVYTEDMKDMITDIPTADVRENVRGEWLNTRPDAPMFGFHYCSICGRKRTSPQDHYCPNCGADMRGDL